ncbi:MAG: hypothetical protein ACFCU6_05605 [Balneolaceae bacterium]
MRILNYKIISFTLLIGLFLFSCDDQTDPASAIDDNVLSYSSEQAENAAKSNRAIQQESVLYWWPPSDNEMEVDGANATLLRNKNGARINIQTRGLQPGHAYTVWVAVFDAPENCDGPCSGAERFREGNPAEATVFGAVAGGIAGGTGTATFAGHIKPGDEPNDIAGPGDGSLDNPLTAEVHFIVRSHGPKIPGLINEQTTTLNGGCPPNSCEDVQFGRFFVP